MSASGRLFTFDAHDYAVRLFGDSIASNMFLLGFAYQQGLIPIGAEAIEEAVALNGAAIEMNQRAFRFGRLAAHDRAALDRIAKPAAKPAAATVEQSLDDLIADRVERLTAYQDAALAKNYRERVEWAQKLEASTAAGRSGFAEAVARSYYKLLAFKDEYEVARLFTDGAFDAAVAKNFDGVRRVNYHMAPPLLAWFWKDKVTGEPRKIRIGGWATPLLRLLAKGRNAAWHNLGRVRAHRRTSPRARNDHRVRSHPRPGRNEAVARDPCNGDCAGRPPPRSPRLWSRQACQRRTRSPAP